MRDWTVERRIAFGFVEDDEPKAREGVRRRRNGKILARCIVAVKPEGFG